MVGTCLVGVVVVVGLVSVVWLLPPPRRLFFFLEPKGFEDEEEDAPKRKSSYDVMLLQCVAMRYNTIHYGTIQYNTVLGVLVEALEFYPMEFCPICLNIHPRTRLLTLSLRLRLIQPLHSLGPSLLSSLNLSRFGLGEIVVTLLLAFEEDWGRC